VSSQPTSAPLDGNALAAPLFEVFGFEGTAATATCGACASVNRVAQLAVFTRAPGTVARCPRCGGVLIVLIERGAMACVDLSGVAALGQPEGA